MTSDASITPPSVSWAQNSDRIYLTFNVECEKPEITIDNKKVYFKAVCAPEQKLHEVEIPLYDEIDPQKSSQLNKGRFIDVVLTKTSDGPFWPTLTSDKKKHHWLKVDFERWQDSSSDESGDDGKMNNMFSNMLSNKTDDFSDLNDKDDSSSAEDEDLPDIE